MKTAYKWIEEGNFILDDIIQELNDHDTDNNDEGNNEKIDDCGGIWKDVLIFFDEKENWVECCSCVDFNWVMDEIFRADIFSY